MISKKAIIASVTLLVLLAGLSYLYWQSKQKLGVALVEVPQFYEDKNDIRCFLVRADKTEKPILQSEYPPIMTDDELSYCRPAVKQTILQDNQFYRTHLYSSSTKVVILKNPGQEAATTTLP